MAFVTLHDWLGALDRSDEQQLLRRLAGPAVLVRLDGEDAGERLTTAPPLAAAGDDDVFVDMTVKRRPPRKPVEADMSTVTGPLFYPLPRRGGMASVAVLPDQPNMRVGRHALADIRINERSLSRSHASVFFAGAVRVHADLLTWDSLPAVPGSSTSGFGQRLSGVLGSFLLADLESHNGTTINGRRLTPYVREPLENGDVVQFADTEHLFLVAREFCRVLPRLVAR